MSSWKLGERNEWIRRFELLEREMSWLRLENEALRQEEEECRKKKEAEKLKQEEKRKNRKKWKN